MGRVRGDVLYVAGAGAGVEEELAAVATQRVCWIVVCARGQYGDGGGA